MSAYTVKTRRITTGSYSVTVDGVTVARVDRTGSHLDDYPWSLLFEDGVTLAESPNPVCEFGTKREAVDHAVYCYLGRDRYWHRPKETTCESE